MLFYTLFRPGWFLLVNVCDCYQPHHRSPRLNLMEREKAYLSVKNRHSATRVPVLPENAYDAMG